MPTTTTTITITCTHVDDEYETRAKATDNATAEDCNWDFVTPEFYAAVERLARQINASRGRKRCVNDLVHDTLLHLALRPQDTVGADFGVVLHRAKQDMINDVKRQAKAPDSLDEMQERVVEPRP